uniref:Oleosin Cor a 15 n=1 Tax=Corylus avellana TaxID=13451 RepID=OLE15_CORAV|nr:RecName: Full=Oleosin Cor a 15; AltName: Allergen=Cor a 15 [Corylus avellana]QEM21451.1 oleosin Cor-a-15 [Corylus avellana]
MADYQHQQQHQRPADAFKGMFPEKGQAQVQGPSASKVIAVVTLLPLGGFLLLLAGLTFAGTLIGLALSTPLFVLCSPVLVPAAIVIGLAVTGFLTSGAFGITGISSLSWILKYLRGTSVPEQMEHAKRRAQDTAGHLGQKARETGQTVTGKGQEAGKTLEGGRGEEKKT